MSDNRTLLFKGLDAAGLTAKQAQHVLDGGDLAELPDEVQLIMNRYRDKVTPEFLREYIATL